MSKPSRPDYGKLCDTFAMLVRAKRESLGLSMSEVAQRAGLSQQMVSYVERGLRVPTLESMYRLSHALSTPLRDLID
ncbi:XRE family transcriptional regulator [bacterium]|jgi:transcriptional regulator with XRE-family HTH domain|nr:XRE family transcriptional regulator [bacterium]